MTKVRPMTMIVSLVTTALLTATPCTLLAQPLAWQQEKVDWKAGNGSRIKSIRYPAEDPHHLRTRRPMGYQWSGQPAANIATGTAALSSLDVTAPDTSASLSEVNSPPISGFVPWIAVAITDARSDDFDFDAVPRSGVSGNYLTSEPNTGYAIGILDTGASTHILSAEGAAWTGLSSHTPSLLTTNASTISGVTGEASLWVTKPLGLFIDGLGAIDANSLALDPSTLFGETNVSISAGDPNGSPYVPTAIGTPLSVYCAAAIYNDHPVSVRWNGTSYSGPDVRVYDSEDPCVPSLSIQIPLELRPADVYAVQYTPNLDFGGDIEDWFNTGFDEPSIPSIITNGLTSGQSLFFLSSVDLTHNGKSATERTKFIVDTGAQVTVISKAIAARLRLNLNNPEFEVEVEGVSGDSVVVPAFLIDLIELPGLPDWLTFHDVPAIVLDVASPEGGVMDGIIGMNLFTDFNLVFHGGGMFLQPAPYLEVERISRFSPADIVPDGVVDGVDLVSLVQAWLSEPGQERWNPLADVAPLPSGDGRIDLLDFALLASHWHQTR